MSADFGATVERYLRTPTPASLRDVHRELCAGGNYDPELPLERIAAPYLQNRRYDDLIDRVLEMMPGAMLSPRAHGVLADAYDAVGEHRGAERERTLSRVSLQAILRSGDGSWSRPWSVLHVSDEADVVDFLGRRSEHVRYEERDDRLLDLHRCDDGSEVWFDVTVLHAAVSAGSPTR